MSKFVVLFFLLAAAAPQAPAQEYYFVFLNRNPDKPSYTKEQSDSLFKGHFSNMERLHKLGTLKAAGPVQGGGGIFVYSAASLQAAKDSLQTDPTVRARVFSTEVYPFSIQQGMLCDAGDSITMTNYTLCRLQASSGGEPDSSFFAMHESFRGKLNDYFKVLIDGNLAGSGELFILRGDPKECEAILAEHPLLQSGKGILTVKNLYIARGTFCEQE